MKINKISNACLSLIIMTVIINLWLCDKHYYNIYITISIVLFQFLFAAFAIINNKKFSIKTYEELKQIENEIENTRSDFCNLNKLMNLENKLLKYYDIFKKRTSITITMDYHYDLVILKINSIKSSKEYLRKQKLKLLLK